MASKKLLAALATGDLLLFLTVGDEVTADLLFKFDAVKVFSFLAISLPL